MLLIFPPVAKPCEPPAGVALLSAALKTHGIPCRVYDASIDGFLHLIQSPMVSTDSWSVRALKKRDANLADLRTRALYTHVDRYHQRVYDLNKLVSISVDQTRFKISLSDYADNQLSSLSSRDLLKSAALYPENPFYPFFEERIRPMIQADEAYIGISLCYLNQALVSFALAGWIKANFSNKKLIMGGGLVSSWMSRPGFGDSVDNPFSSLIDILVKGEGEQPLLALMGVPDTPQKHYVPDYDFVQNHDYLAPGTILPFRASIGCYWSKCRFCPEQAETRPYATQRAAKVLADVKSMEAQYHPDYVHFIDNAMTPAFLRALSQEPALGFKWYGFVRFEREFLSLEFCYALKKSGCGMLKLGLESGDQQVLDQMNKGTDLSTASQTLKNLKKAGILTYVYLLFGTHYEDKIAARKTLGFVKAHQADIDYVNLAVFNLPKFSQDADDLETREFYHGDLSLYLNFVHPRGWDRRQVKQFINKEVKKHLAIGSRFRKNPAFFSSNHAMFFDCLGEPK